VTDGAWQTLTLGEVDLGNGYDFYAWRIGVMGHTDGDRFAFDNVRVVSPVPTFSEWIAGSGLDAPDRGFGNDPDRDGLPNGLEAWFGTDPGEFSRGLVSFASNGTVTTFSHSYNENPPEELVGTYQWSPDLTNWYSGDGVDGPPGGPVVNFSVATVGATRMVTATASAPIGRHFIRAKAELISNP
jgi:hypothetical protein